MKNFRIRNLEGQNNILKSKIKNLEKTLKQITN